MKPRGKRMMLILVLLFLFNLSALAAEVPAPEFEKKQENSETNAEQAIVYNDKGMPKIPEFTLPGDEGTKVTLSSLLGKKVVLNFWASWCPPCKAEMPDFQRFYEEKVNGSETYELISVNLADGVQETRESSARFMQDNGFTFPVYYDEDGRIFNMFSNGSIPITAIIDEEGFLMGGMIGMTNYEAILEVLEESK